MTVSLGILPAQIASSQHKTVQDVSGASQGILFVRFESLRVPVDVEQHIRFRSTKTRFDSERSDKNETTFCENENNRMMLYLALASELPRSHRDSNQRRRLLSRTLFGRTQNRMKRKNIEPWEIVHRMLPSPPCTEITKSWKDMAERFIDRSDAFWPPRVSPQQLLTLGPLQIGLQKWPKSSINRLMAFPYNVPVNRHELSSRFWTT